MNICILAVRYAKITAKRADEPLIPCQRKAAITLYATLGRHKPTMKQEIKLTFKILSRHLIIGALVTVFIFWLINEIPNSDYLLARLHIWLTIPFGLTLATWLTSKLIYKQVTGQKRNVYLVAFCFILFSWTIAFLSTALSEGVLATINNRRFEIFDALKGYAIYQLWFYWSVGIIHGLTGGLFLSFDLKKIKQ